MKVNIKIGSLFLILAVISFKAYSQEDTPPTELVDLSVGFVYGESSGSAVKVYEIDMMDFAHSGITGAFKGFNYKYSTAEGVIPKSAVEEGYGTFTSDPEFKLFTGAFGYHFSFGFDVAHIFFQFTFLSQSTIEITPSDGQEKEKITRLDGITAVLLGPSDHKSNWFASHTTIGIGFVLFDTFIVRASAFNLQHPDEIVDPENEELKELCEEQYCFQPVAVTSVDVGFRF